MADGIFDTLSVTGESDLGGDTRVGGNLTVGDSGAGLVRTLTVNGAATLGVLITSGASSLSGTLSVAGATTLNALTVISGQPASLGGTLTVRGAATLADLTVGGAATLNGGARILGNLDVSGTVDGRDVSNDGTTLDQHLANAANPHATTAAQVGALATNGGNLSGDLTITGSLDFGSAVRQMINLWGPASYGIGVQGWTQYYRSDGNFAWYVGGAHQDGELNPGGGTAALVIRRPNGYVGIGTSSPNAKLDVRGAIYAGESDIYFTNPNHNHTGIGNAAGFAAIENATNYGALMILGRAGTPQGRAVKLWDYLQVNGNMDVTGNLNAGSFSAARHVQLYRSSIYVFSWNQGDRTGYVWVNHQNRASHDIYTWFEFEDIIYGAYNTQVGSTTIRKVQEEPTRTLYSVRTNNFHSQGWVNALCVRR